MKWFACMFVCSVLWATAVAEENPFAIQFQTDKKQLSNEDYIELQRQIRIKKRELAPLLEQLYPRDEDYVPFGEFYSRCSRGLGRVLIDPEKGQLPQTRLEKIGNGGDICFVSSAPYGGIRAFHLQSQPDALRESGFNGYFYYRLGGFPNPTGRETQYAGVPYSLKIFMMIETYQLGFNKVIWIDSGLFPLRDPAPLFRLLGRKGALFNGFFHTGDLWKSILPTTWKTLKEITGTDVLDRRTPYIIGAIFGLQMDLPIVQQLISDYYQMVELGTPFLSAFPEEFVLTALLGKPEYAGLVSPLSDRLFWGWEADDTPELERQRQLRNDGYFFYLRRHQMADFLFAQVSEN